MLKKGVFEGFAILTDVVSQLGAAEAQLGAAEAQLGEAEVQLCEARVKHPMAERLSSLLEHPSYAAHVFCRCDAEGELEGLDE